MRKLLLFILAIPLLSLSCDKKKQTPEEYFSFYADGKYYNYPQKTEFGFLGKSQALYAGFSTGSLGFFMGASDFSQPTTPGRVKFWLSEFPSQDTIILEANENFVTITSLLYFHNDFRMYPPLSGRIIFTERTTKKLTGIFDFDAVNIYDDTTIIHITQGKFSIIPSL